MTYLKRLRDDLIFNRTRRDNNNNFRYEPVSLGAPPPLESGGSSTPAVECTSPLPSLIGCSCPRGQGRWAHPFLALGTG